MTRGLFDDLPEAPATSGFPYGKPDPFDPAEGLRRKEQGIAVAQEHAESLLARAREIAVELAKDGRTITADDVQEVLFQRTGELLGKAAGGLFRGSQWQFTGERRASTRSTNHGHENRVWRLKHPASLVSQ